MANRTTVVDNAVYDRVADTWWDEDGFMALLRMAVNPPRVAYLQTLLTKRLRLQPNKLHVLDVGCGGGLIAEPLAALGCRVTGIDRSVPTLTAARVHAANAGLSVRYLEANAATLPFPSQSFDVVCCCDVLEHVDEPGQVVGEIARVLKPGGVFFFDTINRTFISKLVAIKLAQDWWPFRLIPRNVHVWDKFIRPDELQTLLETSGMTMSELTGLSPAGNLFGAVGAFISNRFGRLSFAELGRRIQFRQCNSRSISYMGFAVRTVTN